MMSVATVSAGAAASGYYKAEGYYKAGSPEAEQASSWFGKAAEAAGLSGQVNDQTFSDLLDGQTPDGNLMGRHVDGERKHRPGLDLTFSASKTASIAALVIGDERITDAHDAAVRAAMAVVEERFITTRWQQDGEMRTGPGKGIIAGIYRHDTSRALDPALHSHAVVVNMVLNEKGEYTALRNDDVYKNRKLITEIYRSEFETRVRGLGIETTRGQYGEVNIAGISPEVVKGFSKRRAEILKALKSKGLEVSPENAAKATLATRAAKHKDIDRDALRADWRRDALAYGLEPEQLERGRVGPDAPGDRPDPERRSERGEDRREDKTGAGDKTDSSDKAFDAKDQSRFKSVLDWMKGLVSASAGPRARTEDARQSLAARSVAAAIAHLSERQSVYERSALITAALRFASSVTGGFEKNPIKIETVDAEIDRRIKTGDLFAKGEHGETLTDRGSVALENSILKTWRAAQWTPGPARVSEPGTFRSRLAALTGAAPAPSLSATLASEPTLTEGQKDAIITSLTGPGRYVGVQGYAGTGKTFMLSRLTQLAEARGLEVRGFAPSHQAVSELAAVTGTATTLANITTRERSHPAQGDNSKTVLLIDEASMISARDMRSLMDYAERTNAARVVLVGDKAQLDAVSAGQPFAQLQAAGMHTAVMGEIQRQKSDDLRAAVYDAVRGDMKAALTRLGDAVREADDPRSAAAQDWLARPEPERAQTRILTLTNAARGQINDEIRDGLRAEGNLAQEGVHIDALAARPMSGVERMRAGSYRPGDVVQSLVTSKRQGLSRDALYVVRETDLTANRLLVEHEADGTLHHLPLEASVGTGGAAGVGRKLGTALVAYETGTREMAAGDAVRVRITDPALGLTNGTRGRITATDAGAVTLETRDGRTVELPAASPGARGLEHDYAATAHAVQGESVPHVIVAMSARERMATQKAFYVEISRAQKSAVLYTDNAPDLARTITRTTGVRPTALEARLESARQNAQSTPDPAVKAVGWAIAHLSERAAVYERHDLAIAALRRMPDADIDGVDTEIDRRIDEGSLFASGEDGQTLTDKASVARESAILMAFHVAKQSYGVELKAYKNRSAESTLATKLKAANTLTPGQKDAITTSLTGRGRYTGVQGYAGTGKTHMLERLAHYATQGGYAIKGYAPSHQAVQELSSVLGEAETLAKLITAERHAPKAADNSKTILIVDEASMVSSRDMGTLMGYAERTNAARVVLVGDTQQLDAVASGQPFDQLQEAGMPTALMDDIRRQRDGDLRASVYSAIRGDIAAAMNRLGDNIQQVEDPRSEAAGMYLSLSPEERAGTRVLTLTNHARAEINAGIRAGLKDEGLIAEKDLKISGLNNLNFTAAMLTDATSYAPGMRILSLSTSRDHGLEKNHLYRVHAFDGARNRITVVREADGTKVILPLSTIHNQRELGKSLIVYEAEARKISTGDAVRFRITEAAAGITNGLRARITGTDGGMIRALARDGREIALPAASLAARGIEHDYAATTHAVQGESVENVIVAMEASERLATQKSFYVQISRARDSATLLTDDPEKLQETLEKETGLRPEALAAWLESQRAGERGEGRKAGGREDHQQARDGARDHGQDKDHDRDHSKDKDRHGQDKNQHRDGKEQGAEQDQYGEKFREFEKYAERMLQRQKEITR